MRVWSFRFVLILLLSAPAFAAERFTARVVGISDGDTITVLSEDKRQVKLRLHGIDAPETGQDFGTRAKQVASELAFGKSVTVRPRETDRYGRTVAQAILPDGRSLNEEMVRAGMAWWYRQFASNDVELRRLEAEAREHKQGLWSHPGAVPPWEWRKGTPGVTKDEVVANRRSRLYHAPTCPGRPR